MNASNDVLLRLEGITKVFYTDEVETHALAGIHLEIRNGEYLAIAGPRGCGKSTLLSILPARGALGRRQVAAALDPRPARYTHRRHLHAEQPSGGKPHGR